MVILQITTLDEFHECVVQAMFHFPALAALSIILASIVYMFKWIGHAHA